MVRGNGGVACRMGGRRAGGGRGIRALYARGAAGEHRDDLLRPMDGETGGGGTCCELHLSAIGCSAEQRDGDSHMGDGVRLGVGGGVAVLKLLGDTLVFAEMCALVCGVGLRAPRRGGAAAAKGSGIEKMVEINGIVTHSARKIVL